MYGVRRLRDSWILSGWSLRADAMCPVICVIDFYPFIRRISATPGDALTVHLHVSLDSVLRMTWILDPYFPYACSVSTVTDSPTVA